MRILGWLLFLLGIVFALLLLLAVLGGGDVGWTAFLLSGMIALFGFQLKTYGRGLAPDVNGHTSKATAAEKVPATAESTASLRQALAQQYRLCAIVIGFVMAVMILMGVIVERVAPRPDSRLLPMTTGIGAAISVLIALAVYFTGVRPLRRDLSEGSYLRTTGPVQLVRLQVAVLLRLPDCALLVNQKGLEKALRKISWATVEYSRHGHFVLHVRDRAGQSVFEA